MTRKGHNPRNELTEEEKLQREFGARREKFRQQQLADDRKKLLTRPEFIRVMADILTKGQCFTSVMTGNSWTYHNSGRQDFAREIFADLLKANQNIAMTLMVPDTKYQGIKTEEKDSDVG